MSTLGREMFGPAIRIWVSAWPGLLAVACLLFGVRTIRAERRIDDSGIEVQGRYLVKPFSPRTGKLHVEYIETNMFSVTLYKNAYSLSVTSTWLGKVWWAKFVYDGRSSCYMTSLATLRNGKTAPHEKIQVEVSPRAHAIVQYKVFGVEWPWLVYCLSPDVLPPGETKICRTPFVGPRDNPELLYGWKWEITWSACGRFPASLRMVRDTTLDLDRRRELARDEIECPENMDDWNRFFMYLDGRQWASNGHVRVEYKCLDWLHTNGLSVPVQGVFKVMDHPRASKLVYKWPSEIVELQATSVRIVPAVGTITVGVSPAPAKVYDYRYRRARNDRIFNCATYTLKPGEALRSANDPELLAQAERHLKRGRKYYEPPVSGRHKVLWAVAVVLAIPPVLYLLYRWHDRRGVARQ